MDIGKVIQDPEDYFSSPAEVATVSSLSLEDKIRVLESWQLDAQRLLTSAAENMPGDEQEQIAVQLQEITNTLSDLQKQ